MNYLKYVNWKYNIFLDLKNSQKRMVYENFVKMQYVCSLYIRLVQM